MAKNNLMGRSIEERDSKINNREEVGLFEKWMLVVGSGHSHFTSTY